jgi:hypothetical protein
VIASKEPPFCGGAVYRTELLTQRPADLVKVRRRFERFEYRERAACLAVPSSAAPQHVGSESVSFIDDSLRVARMQTGESRRVCGS